MERALQPPFTKKVSDSSPPSMRKVDNGGEKGGATLKSLLVERLNGDQLERKPLMPKD